MASRAIKRIVRQLVDEWGTRFAILQAGDAESVAVPPANRPQVDEFVGEICDYETNECTPTENPDGMLRKWPGLPAVSRTNVFMNFDLSQEEGTNPYIGSGQLDGNGINPEFFNDIHVRKAFNYCFDYDAYIADAQNGEGIRNNGPIIYGMLGYNDDGPIYDFDLEKCEEEMAAAWDGVLPEVGFRVQMAYNTGNVGRQTACAILQSSLRGDQRGLPDRVPRPAVAHDAARLPRRPTAPDCQWLDRGYPRPAQLGAAVHGRHLRRAAEPGSRAEGPVQGTGHRRCDGGRPGWPRGDLCRAAAAVLRHRDPDHAVAGDQRPLRAALGGRLLL